MGIREITQHHIRFYLAGVTYYNVPRKKALGRREGNNNSSADSG